MAKKGGARGLQATDAADEMTVETVAIAEISQDPANARKHDERNLEAIKASLRRFGQQTPIVVDSSGVVRKGNGTLEAARALGWDQIKIVRTRLQGSEATAYAIADNRTSDLSEFDDDVLAATLQGLVTDDETLLEACGYDEAELAELLDSMELDGDGTTGEVNNPYTRKIEAPIYKPTGKRPHISALTNDGKVKELEAEILEADLPDDVEKFLLAAAYRHRVFNFEQIAEFYCHADATVQRLMERSALVVIDFEKAIEYGYVQLGEKLANYYAEEYATDAE